MKCRRNVTTSERGVYSGELGQSSTRTIRSIFMALSQRHFRDLIYIRFSPLLGYLTIGI